MSWDIPGLSWGTLGLIWDVLGCGCIQLGGTAMSQPSIFGARVQPAPQLLCTHAAHRVPPQRPRSTARSRQADAPAARGEVQEKHDLPPPGKKPWSRGGRVCVFVSHRSSPPRLRLHPQPPPTLGIAHPTGQRGKRGERSTEYLCSAAPRMPRRFPGRGLAGPPQPGMAAALPGLGLFPHGGLAASWKREPRGKP